ncbi:uncharacterized protein ACNFOS_011319 [Eudromia elegans]
MDREPSSPKQQPDLQEHVGDAIKRESQPSKQADGVPQEPLLPREVKATAAAPTRIKVTIPIPPDIYQDSRPSEDSSEVWDHRGREGIGVDQAPGRELGHDEGLAGADVTDDSHIKDGTSPICPRAALKEDASGPERDEDRDIDETAQQASVSLVGQHVSPGLEIGFSLARAKEAHEEHAFAEIKSRDVLGDETREALGETETYKAGEDQEDRKQPLSGEEETDPTLLEPSEISQTEAAAREGEDSGPSLEITKSTVGLKDVVEGKDASLEEAMLDTGDRWTPKKKPSAAIADKAGSRVPLLKGVCPVCLP